MSEDVGRVIGTKESQPLEFWVGVDEKQYVQLDEVLAVTTELPVALPDGRNEVNHYGVVDQLQSSYEGASFHSDVFREAAGRLPVGVSTIAHVSVTRVAVPKRDGGDAELEVLVPPKPGRAVRRASDEDRQLALYFDQMRRRFAAGLSRDGQPVYGNLEFLDGSRGAHVNISGISGVATKTTYALFLLYGLFHSNALPNPHATHAIVFNVKGEDLLYLDKPNAKLPDDEYRKYESLDLPVGPFANVGLWAPSQAGDIALPDTGGRTEGVVSYYWTLREFCRDRMIRFLFADADAETSQLNMLLGQVERWLVDQMEYQPSDRGDVTLRLPTGDPANVGSLEELSDFFGKYLDGIVKNAVAGTVGAFLRRFEAAAAAVSPLVRGIREMEAKAHRFDWSQKQVSVIDINRLSDRAKRFVVGVVVKRLMEEKEKSGTREPLVFLVLDELNKYAPREGHSPIKEVLLDISERGRSLGVVLIGAQQTASEIERRVTANASFRVVGRLDAAESQRAEYGFLSTPARMRSAILKPGTMYLQQPDVPVALLVQFPFPSWATRADEVAALSTSSSNGKGAFSRSDARIDL
jgi:DNA helicase HerA-like ATPase